MTLRRKSLAHMDAIMQRLGNAFSKSLKHLKAAVALHYVHKNLCWHHSTIRCTAAMQAGLTDHEWSVAELVELALEPPPQRRKFRVAVQPEVRARFRVAP